MRTCVVLMALLLVSKAAADDLILYEGFDYTVGDRVIGKAVPAPYSQTWTDPASPTQPGAGTDNQLIATGNVSYVGLPPATGQMLSVPRNIQSNIARVDLPGRPYNPSTSVSNVFFSFAMQLLDLNAGVTDGTGSGQAGSAAQQQGGFIAGLSVGAGTGGMSGAGVYAGQIRIRREVDVNGVQSGFYQLGIHKNNVSPGAAETVWATDPLYHFGLNTPVFVVGQYQINGSSTTDDATFLWVNPTPGSSPAATVTSSGGSDASPASINSFWFRGDTTSPGNLAVDELRIGKTFASVTPTLLVGDYNNDHFVDAGDYVTWRKALESGGTLNNETASIGTVDSLDYDAWRGNFGAPTAAGLGANLSVPEPVGAAIMLVGLSLMSLQTRKKR